MDPTVIVAFISLVGSLGGSLLGVIAATKLTTYRLEQLEKTVEKMHKTEERVDHLEIIVAVHEEKLHNVKV